MAGWKKNIVRMFVTAIWCALGVGAIVLLIAAMQKKNDERCKGYEIGILGNEDQPFLDKKTIEQILFLTDVPTNKKVASFDLRVMEKKLRANVWVRDADVYF